MDLNGVVRGTVTERWHLSEDLEAVREFALHTPQGKAPGPGGSRVPGIFGEYQGARVSRAA